jgi:dTMP kinase
MPRPPFIALEGIDGSGKSTHSPRLAAWFQTQGYQVVQCADPGGTPIGDRLRDLLLHERGSISTVCEVLLFMASKAELTKQVIRPALAAERAVITDRFLLSTIAYQGHAGGLDPEQLWQVGLVATEGLEPDLSIILDLPVTEAAKRRKRCADRVESRAREYHEAVRQGFLLEADRRPDRIAIVDALPPIEAVQARIVQEVRRVMEARTRT